MDLQRFENDRELSIKFASLTRNGRLVDDAGEEYEGLFDSLPDEWAVEHQGVVHTAADGPRHGWLLRRRDLRVAAVAHETGLELLLIGIATEVAATAVVGVTVWLWNRWAEKRKDKPQPPQIIESEEVTIRLPDRQATPALVFEQVVDRFADGRVKETRRWEVRGPVEPERLEALVASGVRSPWAA